jgi:transcriptional regulator with GAF, ATPase, and Fis domain
MFGTLKLHLNRLSAKQKSVAANTDNEQTERALKFFTRVSTAITNAERSSIFVTNPENRKVWLKAGTGLQEHEIEVSTKGSIVGQVIESGKPIMLSGLEQQEGAHKATDMETDFVTHNVICVPIKDHDLQETVGAIQALNKKDGKEFSAEDAAFLSDLSEQVQSRVSRIFLDQEIYGLTEKVLETGTRAVAYLTGAVVILFVIFLAIMLVWLLIPAMS